MQAAQATPERVRIAYVGYRSDGTEFDRSDPERPLELVAGRSTVMEPIMEAAFSLPVGAECVVDVPCEKAYGAYDPKALLTVPRSFIERGERLERGQRIVWRSAQKPQPVAVLVADCDESSVRLDFNHPLAGEDLKYWIKVVSATEKEAGR